MIERRSGFGLDEESLSPLRVRGKFRRQELDRGFAFQPSVLGQKDLSHAARTELGRDPIVADRLADHLSSSHGDGIVENESCSLTLPDRRQRRGETAIKNCVCVGRARRELAQPEQGANTWRRIESRRGNARPTATVRAVG